MAVPRAQVGETPVQIVAMSPDPALLERTGITVAELKSYAAEQLKATGIRVGEVSAGPRLAIAIPAMASGDGAVAFILLQYQVLTASRDEQGNAVYGTVWSKWWGGQATPQELKRGLKSLLDEFVENRRGAKRGGA
jgi:hypothetical protein